MAERGHVLLVLLLVLLFSVSGLALLTHTGLHLQIVGARKDRRLEAAAIERALVLNLHRYREALQAADMNAFQDPENEFFNRARFPDQTEAGIVLGHDFSFVPMREEQGMRVVRVLDLMKASRGGSRLSCSGRAAVDLFRGSLPASEPGLLISAAGGEAAAFLAGRNVEYAGSQLPLVGNFALRRETAALLSAALGLAGQFPDWRRLREKFGLEPSDAPIPSGVYLARAGGEVAAVFVQGDLEKLEFAAGGGRQSLFFYQEGRRCELSYRHGRGVESWCGGDAPEVAGAEFREKLIVHGSVWDIRQAGSAAFLEASRIELLASGRLVVSSGLESENLALGKEKFPGLLLMTCGSDFFSGEEVNADVAIAAAGAATVQAQVLAAGSLVNGGGDIRITGSLVAGDIENSGRLSIAAAAGEFSFAGFVRLPDCRFLKNFRVHFIQEGNDE